MKSTKRTDISNLISVTELSEETVQNITSKLFAVSKNPKPLTAYYTGDEAGFQNFKAACTQLVAKRIPGKFYANDLEAPAGIEPAELDGIAKKLADAISAQNEMRNTAMILAPQFDSLPVERIAVYHPEPSGFPYLFNWDRGVPLRPPGLLKITVCDSGDLGPVPRIVLSARSIRKIEQAVRNGKRAEAAGNLRRARYWAAIGMGWCKKGVRS